MANSKQSRKRARQEVGRRVRNVMLMSRFRTYTKKVRAALSQGDGNNAKDVYGQFVRIADSTARKGIVHRNMTARLKRKLSAAVKELAAG